MRILKINSLPTKKHWLDRDIIMLHACFQLLEDCVEKEKVDTRCNYEAHKEFVDECRFLYNWWQKRKQVIHNKKDDKDQLMLKRLIEIRETLWT